VGEPVPHRHPSFSPARDGQDRGQGHQSFIIGNEVLKVYDIPDTSHLTCARRKEFPQAGPIPAGCNLPTKPAKSDAPAGSLKPWALITAS